MVKEYLEEKRHIREKVKEVLEVAEEQHAEEQFQAFHRRREMQLAELVVSWVYIACWSCILSDDMQSYIDDRRISWIDGWIRSC